MITFSVNPNLYAGFERITKDNLPTTEKGKEWIGEIWLKAHTLDKVVDADAYGYKCDENTKKKDMCKYVPLLTVEEVVEEGKKGISDTVAVYFDENIDEMIERSDIVTVSEEFLDMREYLIAEIDVDLLFVLDKAMQYNRRAMIKLKELTEEFEMFDILKKVMRPDCMLYMKGVVA